MNILEFVREKSILPMIHQKRATAPMANKPTVIKLFTTDEALP